MYTRDVEPTNTLNNNYKGISGAAGRHAVYLLTVMYKPPYNGKHSNEGATQGCQAHSLVSPQSIIRVFCQHLSVCCQHSSVCCQHSSREDLSSALSPHAIFQGGEQGRVGKMYCSSHPMRASQPAGRTGHLATPPPPPLLPPHGPR